MYNYKLIREHGRAQLVSLILQAYNTHHKAARTEVHQVIMQLLSPTRGGLLRAAPIQVSCRKLEIVGDCYIAQSLCVYVLPLFSCRVVLGTDTWCIRNDNSRVECVALYIEWLWQQSRQLTA